jgi:hypothetical protein
MSEKNEQPVVSQSWFQELSGLVGRVQIMREAQRAAEQMAAEQAAIAARHKRDADEAEQRLYQMWRAADGPVLGLPVVGQGQTSPVEAPAIENVAAVQPAPTETQAPDKPARKKRTRKARAEDVPAPELAAAPEPAPAPEQPAGQSPKSPSKSCTLCGTAHHMRWPQCERCTGATGLGGLTVVQGDGRLTLRVWKRRDGSAVAVASAESLWDGEKPATAAVEKMVSATIDSRVKLAVVTSRPGDAAMILDFDAVPTPEAKGKAKPAAAAPHDNGDDDMPHAPGAESWPDEDVGDAAPSDEDEFGTQRDLFGFEDEGSHPTAHEEGF